MSCCFFNDYIVFFHFSVCPKWKKIIALSWRDDIELTVNYQRQNKCPKLKQMTLNDFHDMISGCASKIKKIIFDGITSHKALIHAEMIHIGRLPTVERECCIIIKLGNYPHVLHADIMQIYIDIMQHCPYPQSVALYNLEHRLCSEHLETLQEKLYNWINCNDQLAEFYINTIYLYDRQDRLDQLPKSIVSLSLSDLPDFGYVRFLPSLRVSVHEEILCACTEETIILYPTEISKECQNLFHRYGHPKTDAYTIQIASN